MKPIILYKIMVWLCLACGPTMQTKPYLTEEGCLNDAAQWRHGEVIATCIPYHKAKGE